MQLKFTTFSAESDCFRFHHIYYVCAAQSCVDICSGLLNTLKLQINAGNQEQQTEWTKH